MSSCNSRGGTRGVNPHSNSLVAPATLLKKNPEAMSAVVKATQRAETVCLANPAPCIDALVEASPNLQREKELANRNARSGSPLLPRLKKSSRSERSSARANGSRHGSHAPWLEEALRSEGRVRQ